MENNKKLVAVTMGDPSGISTEIIIKSWKSKKLISPFFVIHDPDYISKIANQLGLKIRNIFSNLLILRLNLQKLKKYQEL